MTAFAAMTVLATALLVAVSFCFAAMASAGSYQLVSQFGSSGSEKGQLESPYGLAVINYEGADYVFVVDSGNDRVQIFDPAGGFQGAFGSSGSGQGEFDQPSGIAVADDLTVFVADTGNDRVQVLNAGGDFERFLGAGGSGGPGSLLSDPVGVALDTQGDVLVTEAAAGRVSRFNSAGDFVSSFGSPGAGPGNLNVPVGLAVDGSRNVLVVDSLNHRIQRFSSSGQFLSQLGTLGSGQGQFDLPFGLALGPGGLFVSELGNSRIQQLSPSGEFVSAFGDFGIGTAESSRPGWLALGSDGDLYVSDEQGDRILRYAARNTLAATRTGSGSGSVTSAPAGLDCGSVCSTGVAPGSSVTLSASAAPGSTFTGWSGEGCSGTGSCTVLMDRDRQVSANFTLDRSLTVSRTGQGSGSVTSTPAGIDCGNACSASFSEGTTVTLSAAPDAGSTFTGWSGGGCSGTAGCTVSMDGDLQVSAGFASVAGPPEPKPKAVPRVKVTGKPSKKTRSKKAKFKFRSSVQGSRFQCRLDRGGFSGCRSPKTYKRLKPGRHKVKIRAVADGVTGPAVTVKWKVRR